MTDVQKPRQTSRLRRIFAWQNVTAVAVGLAFFLIALQVWPTNRGAILATIAAGIATTIAWLVIHRLTGDRSVVDSISTITLGNIPETIGAPIPALTAPASAASSAYARTLSRLEASKPGRVILVSGLRKGDGATTAALNLATTATRAGRNVLLIDGNAANNRLSRFGSTGWKPGLLELARQESSVQETARMWTIDDRNRFPFIPSGEPNGNPTTAAAIDRALVPFMDVADFILVDTPTDPAALASLGTVADGTVLVGPAMAAEDAIAAAVERTTTAGAAPIGYIVNEASPTGDSADQHVIFRSLKRGLGTALVLVAAFAAWNGYQLWDSWNGVERESFNVEAAEDALPTPTGPIEDPLIDDETSAIVTAVPSPPGEFRAFLVVGSDLSGSLADVIILALLPGGNEEPVLVSLPRDLYLPNRCTQSYTKINANLAGCPSADINGSSLLALAVEDFTGITVDNVAGFTFEGFERIIDAVGGIEICTEYQVRDRRAELDLPAGCTQASGTQALSWVRSRTTQELVNGAWRVMDDVSDLTRNERQQDVILKMFSKLNDFSSPAELTSIVGSLTDAFTLDEGLGISDAISLAWELRDINPETVRQIEIPVDFRTTENGAAVLIPTRPFNELLDETFGNRESLVTD